MDMTSRGVFVHCTVEEGKLILDRILSVTPLEDHTSFPLSIEEDCFNNDIGNSSKAPADAMHSKRMFHEVIFLRYEVPRIVISDGGSHFIDRTFQKALSEVGVDHRIATPYHPQRSGQAETSNKQIKNTFKRQ
jgi:hypothetical protein